jgi:ABC-type multidrug transport system ATPase subunit
MRGLAIIAETDRLRIEELARSEIHVALDAAGRLLFQHPGCTASPVASIAWEEALGAWKLTPLVPEHVLWDGAPLRRPVPLGEGDFAQLAAVPVWFRRIPAPPKLHGRDTPVIPLAPRAVLVLGRSPDSARQGETFVLLDPEDRKISRRHVALHRDGSDWLIRDESQTGTFLNGQRFESHRLIVGDRFQIGAYSFEFTGLALRQTPPRIGGKIEADEVGFAVGTKSIIRSINLQIEPCSFVGILGGSGQGKSTLLNALCGINPATTGDVLIEGRPIANAESMRTAGIGYVPQDDIVHPELRVNDAIRFSARLRLDPRIPPRQLALLVEETISRLGLTEHQHKRISQLSGGQRKRVSIATELLAKPAVLFLDEPSSGLDPATEFALMRILRGLAAHDCTVVCTTHVLGRAYLFDKILFVHGGRVIFDGQPAQAHDFFQVESLDQVYVRVAEQGRPGDDLATDFAQNGPPRAFVPPSPPKTDLPGTGDVRPEPRPKPGFLRSLGVLLRRQWAILAADSLNVLFLLAQPLLIALLIGWVAEDYVLRMFLCVVATLWFGCSNGAQQIIRELPIFRRERLCGLGLNAYLFSKYLLLGTITAAQAVLLLVVVQSTSHLVRPTEITPATLAAELIELTTPPETTTAPTADEAEFDVVGAESASAPTPTITTKKPPAFPRIDAWLAAGMGWFFELRPNLRDAVETGHQPLAAVLATTVSLKLLALIATALVGIAIGLAISGLVQNPAQAVMWVPLILIPQILFGGVVLSLPELSRTARAVCAVIPSFSCQRLMDVSNVYGQSMPLLSNRTELPLFLTPGEKDAVTWSVADRTYTEYYDKLSPMNTSWQNLAVFPQAVGEHRHVFAEVETRAGSRKRIFNETTETRDDVRYSKGRVFLNLVPATVSLIVLTSWIAACYIVTLAALAMRQKGKF